MKEKRITLRVNLCFQHSTKAVVLELNSEHSALSQSPYYFLILKGVTMTIL
ncbi:Peptidoglycan hydrolase, Autolysin2 [Streptococcus gallolyticus]|uniref:Peptidoglycan hydrolase, Autolysin2 n=1 Tax=Streptococcus gallolyticus TaxID=315405 RepID=A0A139QL37_9STRE|nr:Peptidoglycan hydrolase, Autolysin2 [Streptococcus gallolyticus]KXU03234.1 Peptidoglycan hydrolase, Autolysin2 [Streptococcus gallolyticus]